MRIYQNLTVLVTAIFCPILSLLIAMDELQLETPLEHSQIRVHKTEQEKISEIDFLDIDPTSFTAVGKHSLARLEAFSPDFPIPVLKFDYSPLNNGSLSTIVQIPPAFNEKQHVLLKLTLLTNNEQEKIKGRVLFNVQAQITHHDGSIEKFHGSSNIIGRNVIKVRSANGDKLAKSFVANIRIDGARFKEDDILVLNLTRDYKIPDNYQSSVSVKNVRIEWSPTENGDDVLCNPCGWCYKNTVFECPTCCKPSHTNAGATCCNGVTSEGYECK